MKASLRRSLEILAAVCLAATASAQTTYTLNPLTSFGGRGDGSIQPGDSIGTSPVTGHTIQISAPFTAGVAYGVQPGDLNGATNGFNMRGIAYDPVSGNLIFVDTHAGQGGSATMVPNAAIYVLDPNSGQIIAALNTNGMAGGSYTHVVAGVADDGVVYVCNQTTASTTTGFKIYRWVTANTNDPNFNLPPTVAFTNTLSPSDRLGQTMDVRGAGTNTQIIVGSSSQNGTGTNVYLFTTADGTNFASHRLFFPGITTSMFNDGVAFGPGNSFFAKQVGQPLLFLSFDTNTFTGGVISSFTASSVSGIDPLYNLAGLKVDNVHHLLAAVEEVGGAGGTGPGKVWLFDIYDPTNKAPAILSSRTYVPNFSKAVATMGYLAFGPGRLYVNVVNNGMLASTVDSVTLSQPALQLPPDYPNGQPKLTDLPATNRVAVGQTAHFEVFATPDVTNYQWYSNNVAIAGANTYFFNVPNAQTNNSGAVYKVIAYNAVGSVESTHSMLLVVSAGNYFHPVYLWSFVGGATNYITSTGAANAPNERCIAYNAVSNQLLVVRGSGFAQMRVYVVDAQTGAYLYPLNTNGMVSSVQLPLCGIGVADDGAVYACSVSSTAAADQSFKVYRWADTGPNTVPQVVFGTNSSAANGNPIFDQVGNQNYRFGDALAVHGAGINTEIVVDPQNITKYAGVLAPTDSTMTNWTQTGYLLQNTSGSYGFGAYGTAVGRSLQFGPVMPSPLGGNLPTFWQKRYNAAGAPLAVMSYTPSSPIAALNQANLSLPLYTNGPVGINFTLGLAAAVNFVGNVGANSTTADTLALYDLSDPLQAVFLSSQNLPGGNGGGHLANANAIAEVVFGYNPATGTNYVFAIDGNNGIAAYVLAGGVTPPPKVLAQPKNLRILQGGSGSLNVALDQAATVEWFKGTNPPVDTGVSGNAYSIANAQPGAAGDYFMIGTNVNGSVTSLVAHVTVSLANDNYSLSQAWGANPTNASFPYVTANGGANTPNERSFAYNALSNQLVIVQNPVSSDAFRVFVVDAATGTSLYTLNTNGIINEGASEVNGANGLDLDAVTVADDGAVYVCSLSPNASGGQFGDTNKMLHVFRWADSGPNTLPVLIYQGDPSGQQVGINYRWGDVITARGSGTNTELVLNSHDGAYGAILRPTDSTMTVFSNYWFFDAAGPGTIGRSLQFGATNTVYEKRHGGQLVYSRYSTNPPSSTLLGAIDSSSTLGGVFVDTAHSLAAGVDFVGGAGRPDAVALYDISDPTTPMLIKRYNFPVNEVANNNFICQTVINGWKVYALDANNGLMAFYINPSVNSMTLNSTNTGSHLHLSWGNSNAVLQGTTNLSPSSWVDLTTPPQTNSVQPLTGGSEFYRLIQRR
jgi:hypothetical protein